jgi:polyisoprenyl-phosphate glycosyltransferase
MSAVLRALNGDLQRTYDYEIIFVNDGSRDASWEKIQAVCEKDPHAKGICLSRNFGQMAALEAGIEASKGDAVVTIDCDLEDPPEVVRDMIAVWEAGHEIVVAKRVYKTQRSWIKRKTSDIFYGVFNMVCDVRLETGMSEFRLMDRQVADVIALQLTERELFLRGMFQWVGYKIGTVTYEKGERSEGETSYTFKRMIKLAWVGISSFSSLPLRFVLFMGIAVSVLATLLLILMSVMRWGTETIIFTDISFLVVFIILSNGMIMSALGIVSLYVMRIHNQVLGRPSYLIWKKINF